MPIQFITGLPRAGKTLWTLTHVKERAEKENRQVYFCNIPGVTIPGWEEIDHPDKWLDLPNGAIIVVDELQDFWGKQPTGAKVPLPILELSKHGKRGFDFYFITQEPNLVHSTPRDLCAHHWYVIRAWGAQAAVVYRFERMQQHPEKVKSKGEKFPWKYNTAAYAWYKSADVHNIKRQIPKKVIAIPLFALLAVAMIAAAVFAFQWTVSKAKAGKDAPKQEAAQPVAPGAAPGGGRPGQAVAALTPAEYVKSYQPRVPGLAHTAPAYDDLTRPRQVPLPAACMESRSNGCKCFTQQATPYQTTDEICRQVVRHGVFLAFLEPVRAEGAAGAEKRAKVDPAHPAVPGEPVVIAAPAPSQAVASSQQPAAHGAAGGSGGRVPKSSPWSFQAGG